MSNENRFLWLDKYRWMIQLTVLVTVLIYYVPFILQNKIESLFASLLVFLFTLLSAWFSTRGTLFFLDILPFVSNSAVKKFCHFMLWLLSISMLFLIPLDLCTPFIDELHTGSMNTPSSAAGMVGLFTLFRWYKKTFVSFNSQADKLYKSGKPGDLL